MNFVGRLRNMSNVGSNSTNNTLPSAKKKVYEKKFCEHWLNEPIFATWLEKYDGNVYHARCKACKSNFKGGKSELLRHVKTIVHTIRIQRLGTSSEAKTNSRVFSFSSDSPISHWVRSRNLTS